MVQALPSSQDAAVCVHPVAGAQPSVVQASPSSQLIAVWVQPDGTTHASVVQALASSQLVPPLPAHTPPLHTSPDVHAFPSSHVSVLLVCVQPVEVLQASVVQTLPSLQLCVVCVHPVDTLQPSSVQALLSLQLTAACVQPENGLHASVVQALESLQFGGGPPTQVPLEHTSPVVHALPSVQATVLKVCVHPDAGLQPSLVQMLPSLQLTGVPPHDAP